MKILAFTYIITVLVSLAQALRIAGEQKTLETRDQDYSSIFFVDCWGASGGANSKLVFLKDWPTTLPIDPPSDIQVLSNSENWQFEPGDSISVLNNTWFQWQIGNPDVSVNVAAGNATYNQDSSYVIYKGSGATMYQNQTFDCKTSYYAKLSVTNSTTKTSVLSPPTQPTQANQRAGPPLAALLGIGIGIPTVVGLCIALIVIISRRHQRRRACHVAPINPIEMDASVEKALSSRSMMTIDSTLTPISAVSELHPDAMIEMADTDRRLRHEKLAYDQYVSSPSETSTVMSYLPPYR